MVGQKKKQKKANLIESRYLMHFKHIKGKAQSLFRVEEYYAIVKSSKVTCAIDLTVTEVSETIAIKCNNNLIII